MQQILKILQKTYPDVTCPLKYSTEFELLVAVILSAQCTDKRVNLVTPQLFKTYPSIEEYAKADLKKLEELIHTTGFYRNKAKAIKGSAQKIIQEFNGKMPNTLKDLTSLPGVGRKTANVTLNEIHNKDEGIAVDTHVTRVAYRLGLTKNKDPKKIEQDLMQKIPKKRWSKVHLELIYHGRAICKARKPHCTKCPLNKICPREEVRNFY